MRSLSETQLAGNGGGRSGWLDRVWMAGAALLESLAPLGYEDESGFHFGTPQAGSERRN
jgi:hypothetical protein